MAGSTGPAVFPHEFRSIDGSGNNPIDPTFGATNTPLLRETSIGYADGVGTPGGANEPSAREISNGFLRRITSFPARCMFPITSGNGASSSITT